MAACGSRWKNHLPRRSLPGAPGRPYNSRPSSYHYKTDCAVASYRTYCWSDPRFSATCAEAGRRQENKMTPADTQGFTSLLRAKEAELSGSLHWRDEIVIEQ